MASYSTNRVFNVLVAGTAASGVASGIGNVANGEVIIVKRDGSLATPTDIYNYHLTGDKVSIVIGGAGNYVVQKTPLFSPKDITKYGKQDYVAEVQKVMTINYTGFTVTANYEYTLIINEISDHEILQNRQARKQYTYVAGPSDTLDTVNAALVLAVNNDKNAPVTASYASPVITLTAKDTSALSTRYNTSEFKDQINFVVESKVTQSSYNNTGYNNYYSIYGATPVVATAIGYGEGTYRQMYTLERLQQAYQGASNFTSFPQDPGVYYTTSGTTYDVRIIELAATHGNGQEVVSSRYSSPITYIIAFPTTASATKLAFDSFFGVPTIGPVYSDLV